MRLTRIQIAKLQTLQTGLIQKFPWVYKLYCRLPHHQRTLKKLNKQQQEQKLLQDDLIKKLLHNRLMIRNGPFKGMKYLHEAFGSLLMPKLIGSYKEPIQEWIKQIINDNHYRLIVDVGCAEGYYAVGLARALPNIKMLARDVTDQAQSLTVKLAKLNKVSNITVGGIMEHCDLEKLPKGAMLICDIEGAENELLDPKSVPKLKYIDMIIEAHDIVRPGTTKRLVERFIDTHKIEIVYDYPKNYAKYLTKTMMKHLGKKNLELVFHERPLEAHMQWIKMTSLV